MDDLLSEFITETSESLTEVDMQLVEFEKNPNNKSILGNIFRLVHTVKGTCGFLGLPRLESVAHAGENVLDKFRDGDLEVTPDAVSLILKCIDKVRELLERLEETGEEPAGDDVDLIAELNALADGKAGSAPAGTAKPAAPAPAPAPAAAAPAEPSDGGPMTGDQGFPVAAELMAEYEEATGGGDADDGGPLTGDQGFPVAAELMAEYEQATAPAVEAAPVAEAAPAAAAPAPSVPAITAKKEAAPAAEPAKSGGGGGGATASIRVNVEVLEDLMTMVSEMVLTRNQLLQMIRGQEDSEFTVPIQRLSHITTDLQEGVMKTRMQPIGNAWAKLPRIVRDLSVETGKKIDLQMLGAETELDRQVLDLIKDPLTHMVRNSADHGLEVPDDRLMVGKPELGTITLKAYHEGGHIIIQILDDGRGLNMDRIKTKCVENGLASEAELEGMSDTQIQQFIFRAGFSTAEKVTSVSGRGVGMDVVRTNIEKIGGTIELKSVEGEGSTFTIKIPLTLAIVSALIVESAKERFAIPQISVLELVRASKHSENNVEMINESPVLRLRNRLLPLVHLGNLLKMQNHKVDQHNDEELFIVVAQVGTYTFGIIVDRVFDTEEIVVKPTAPILRDITFYSGNTILGDGSVIMIIDPNGIAAATGQAAATDVSKDDDRDKMGAGLEEKSSMLIFRAGGEELKAVPLALIARLEEVEMSDVEMSHNERVVQYRGQLMPLIPFNPGHAWKEDGRQPILVFTESDRSMGLVVDEIVDIVEDNLKVEIAADQPGLIGGAVIDGHATDVIDAGYYLTQAFSDWFGGAGEDGMGGAGRAVLLVDDSPFFRNLLAPMLSVAGYNVTSVENAMDALSMRDKGYNFDVIISDIEMPEMDGFQFAQAVRADARWEKTPMVALSARVSDEDFQRGRDVGFSDYVAKTDRDELVRSLAQAVSGVVG